MPPKIELIPQDLEAQMLHVLAVISEREQIYIKDLRDQAFLSKLVQRYRAAACDSAELSNMQAVRLSDMLTLRQGILNTTPGFLGKLGLLWQYPETTLALSYLGKYYFLSWLLLFVYVTIMLYGTLYDFTSLPGYLDCYQSCPNHEYVGSNCQISCATSILGEAAYKDVSNHNRAVDATLAVLLFLLLIMGGILFFLSFKCCCEHTNTPSFWGITEMASWRQTIHELNHIPYHRLPIEKLGPGHQERFRALTYIYHPSSIEAEEIRNYNTLSATDKLSIFILITMLQRRKLSDVMIVDVSSKKNITSIEAKIIFFRMLIKLFYSHPSVESINNSLLVGSINTEPSELTQLLPISSSVHDSGIHISSMFSNYRMTSDSIRYFSDCYPETQISLSSLPTSSSHKNSRDYDILEL